MSAQRVSAEPGKGKIPMRVVRHEVRKRGFFGKLFKGLFILWNVLMAWWLFAYWGQVAPSISDPSGDAVRAGAAIGTAIGSGMIVFFWCAGAVILGLLVLLSRGKTVVTEEYNYDQK